MLGCTNQNMVILLTKTTYSTFKIWNASKPSVFIQPFLLKKASKSAINHHNIIQSTSLIFVYLKTKFIMGSKNTKTFKICTDYRSRINSTQKSHLFKSKGWSDPLTECFWTIYIDEELFNNSGVVKGFLKFFHKFLINKFFGLFKCKKNFKVKNSYMV